MAGHLQVLGTNTGDSTPCVYIFTDHASYFFNCGEAIQRVCVAHRVRLARLQGVFVTQMSAPTLGGLPGMALTLAEVGLSAVRVYGPPPIVQFLHGMECFYRPGKIQTGCVACSNSGVIENKQCEKCVESIKKQREEQQENCNSTNNAPTRGNLNITPIPCLISNEFTHLDSNIKVSSALLQLPDNPKQAVCYIVQAHPTPGKFDEKKSRALGIKSNDSRKGDLAGGRSIELEVKNAQGELEKRVVHPSEVVGEPMCGLALAIVDCPTSDFILPLMNHSLFHSFQSASSADITATSSLSSTIPPMRPLLNQTYLPDKEPEIEALWRQVGRATQLEIMVHMSPFEVVCEPQYQAWMASFGSNIKHVMLNAAQCRQEHIFNGYVGIHHRLREVNNQVFPSLAWNTLDPRAEIKDVPVVNPHMQVFEQFPYQKNVVEGALLWKYMFIPRNKAKIDITSLLPRTDISPSLLCSSSSSSSSLPLPPTVIAKRKRVEEAEMARKKKMEFTQQKWKHKRKPGGERNKENDKKEEENNDGSNNGNSDVCMLHSEGENKECTPSSSSSSSSSMMNESVLCSSLSPSVCSVCSSSSSSSSSISPAALLTTTHTSTLDTTMSVTTITTPSPSSSSSCIIASSSSASTVLTEPVTTPTIPPSLSSSISTTSPVNIHLPLFPTPNLDAICRSAEEPVVAFLGTGSAMPAKYRNVTGIYFNPSEGSTSGMLLDCGEGTYGQLTRMRGVQGVKALVSKLACVWISHMHADHHLGLVRFVEEFADQWSGGDRLLIIGPDKLSSWLQSFGEAIQHPRWDACHWCVTCEELSSSTEAADFLNRRVGASLMNVPVLHCYDAWGLIINHQRGYKVVYSGDTEYCPALVEAGRNATVLIHEATMGPSMEQQAAEKRHSTITDAVRAGEDMNAERIILTHFSQRYAKIPELGENPVPNPNDNTTRRHLFSYPAWLRSVYAFDLMEIRFKLLGELPSYQAPLRKIFDQTNDDET